LGGGVIVKLLGLAPDSDPTILGVLTNCANIVPSLKGMKGAPAPQSAGTTVFHATCQGAAVAMKLDNTTRFFAGSNSVISELTDVNTWTSRGSGYGLSEDDRWRFAQFGDVSLAANKNNTIQASTTSAFANVSGAPRAAIIETVGNFVFAFDTTEATYGDSPHRWWCSAIGTHNSWVPSVSSQAATGILTSSPGPITAGRRFGDAIIVCKNQAMYRGDYVGTPAIWSFSQIPGEVGALCQEVVVNVGTPDSPRLIFMGPEDFYTFDGSRPVTIGTNRIKIEVYGQLLRSKQEQCIALHDKTNSNVYFFYPSSDSPNPDKCVVYNYRTNQWGRADQTIEAAVEYIVPGLTYADIGTSYATYADLPSAPYGSAFWSQGFPTPAIFNTAHSLMTLNGNTATSSITTGDIGDDLKFLDLSRMKCRYITAPTSASMVNYYRNNIGDSLTTDATTSETDDKFDVMREARWHRFRIDFVGPVELSGLIPEFVGGGLE
jgi:hypothetical protein